MMSLHNKLTDPISDIQTSAEVLLSGAFGRLSGDQREGVKTIYMNANGLYTLVMDILTSITVETITTRPYLRPKYQNYLQTLKFHSEQLLGEFDGPLSEEQVIALDYVMVNIEMLILYFEKLWDYSAILQNNVNINQEQCVLEHILKPENFDIDDESLVTWDIPSNLGHINVDSDRLIQIIAELIINAIHYAPSQPITVRAEVEDNHMNITVTDKGKGISPLDYTHIFEPFYQADSYGNGLGLGLSIVKSLTELQNGEIKIITSPTLGTQAQLTFPLVTL